MSDDLGKITTCYQVTFHRRSRHSAARLWSAITRADEVAAWMGYPARVDLRVGGEWHIDFTETHSDVLPGVIVRVEPERVLAYAWGLSVVEWTLEDSDDGCRYRFVHAGQADRGEDEEGLPAGWHEFLDHLDAFLEGRSSSAEERHAAWLRLKPAYREQLNRVVRR